jgi:signal transduction histidine kinase
VAHLVVEDVGPGIDAPEAALGRGATRAGSTGLGLDIARQAAEAAGGRIEVGRSALGGARVAVVVPLVGAPER